MRHTSHRTIQSADSISDTLKEEFRRVLEKIDLNFEDVDQVETINNTIASYKLIMKDGSTHWI